MEKVCNWHLIEDAAGGAAPRIRFDWEGRDPEEFNESELNATIRVLRMQGQDTAEYERGLQAVRGAKSPSK